MGLSRTLYVCSSIALALASLGACASESKKGDMKTAGQGALPPLMADNIGSAGTAAGSAGTVATPSAGAGGTSASSAGTSGGNAGTGGNTAGTSGGSAGSAGSMAAMAGSSAAGAGDPPDAGAPDDEDPFGLLGPAEVSCEGLLCVEAADCATLYPDENATCKFTTCVDFECM